LMWVLTKNSALLFFAPSPIRPEDRNSAISFFAAGKKFGHFWCGCWMKTPPFCFGSLPAPSVSYSSFRHLFRVTTFTLRQLVFEQQLLQLILFVFPRLQEIIFLR
jgi:hypothetical protein